MGKVKAWAMDEEEKFYDIAIKVSDDLKIVIFSKNT